MKAFDTSRYACNNQPIPAGTVSLLRQEFELAIIGSWHGIEGYDAAEASLNACRLAGMVTATYAALSPGHDAQAAVAAAVAACGAEWPLMRFCAIDCETEGVTHEQIADAAVAIARAKQVPIIYTSQYKWQQLTGNTSDFSSFKLWDAHYDNDPSLDFISSGYGGWQLKDLAGDQYTNSTAFGAIDIDYNVFSDSWVHSIAPVDPMHELLLAWQTDMEDLARNAESLVAMVGDDLALALHKLYTDKKQQAWHALLT